MTQGLLFRGDYHNTSIKYTSDKSELTTNVLLYKIKPNVSRNTPLSV